MSDGARILAVDDEPTVRELCRDVLEAAGHHVDLSAGADDALHRLRSEAYDLVVTDLKMPHGSGLDLIRDARQAAPDVPFVVLTGYPSIEAAVEAVREGAEDFIPKPFSTDDLQHAVRRALDKRGELREMRRLRAGQPTGEAQETLLGPSRAMQHLRPLVRRAAPTESNVLILGASGVGKELVARRIHALSPRAEQPFVSVDCAASPDSVLEREMLGHEKGAFPGAVIRARGLIESARRGTLFLDDVGGLSDGLQSKLLRLLEERRLCRVGGTEWIPVDLRVVAAGSDGLPEAVSAGRFREDLFFHLSVIPIQIPALCDRPEDISTLAEAFLRESSHCRPEPPRRLSAEALEALMRYPWPGNVRELRNAVERMASLADGTVIELHDVPPEILAPHAALAGRENLGNGLGFREAKRLTVDRFEREYLHRLLAAHAGNVTRSSGESGMKRSAFQRLMRKHGLSSGVYRDAARRRAIGREGR